MSDETCPNCGAPVQPGQDWCLRCGSALDTRIAQTPNWRAPLAIVAAVVVLAAGGIAVAFIELSDDAERVAAKAPTGAGPAPRSTAPAQAGTPAPSPSPTASPTAEATPTATNPPSGTTSLPTVPDQAAPAVPPGGTPSQPGEVASWPAGQAKWTVVVKSTRQRSEADAAARALAGGGAPAGVLRSDDFSSLRKGYWVVFSGQYDSRADAEKAAKGLGPKAPGAYARFVKPR